MRNKKGRFKKGYSWRKPQPYYNKEWLFNEYITKKRSTYSIADELGVWPNAIKRFLVKHKISIRKSIGENHGGWKGSDVSYRNLHRWVEYHLKRPKICQKCGTIDPNKRYEWANKSKKYLRNLEDWLRLCASCHKKYDNIIKNIKFSPHCNQYNHKCQKKS